jgi:hypothetical protein
MFEPSDEEKLVKPSSWTAAVFDDIARTLSVVLVVGPSPPGTWLEAQIVIQRVEERILAIG